LAKELKVLWDLARTPTILDRNFVDAVCVQDQHVGVARNGVMAEHTTMVELQLQPKFLQRNPHKNTVTPFLAKKVRREVS